MDSFRRDKSVISGDLPEDTGTASQDDPPLLEDIGIDLEQIKRRMLMVVKLEQPSPELMQEADLFGPFAIAMVFGGLLMASGKLHYGDIYAMFVMGNALSYFLINLTTNGAVISLHTVMSILGYSLLPMLLLALLGVFADMRSSVGVLSSLVLAGWSSYSAGGVINSLQEQPQSHRYLIVYPLFLFYLAFAIIVIV